MENFKVKLKSIKAFIFDIDGVLTDGSVAFFPNGEQAKFLNIKDCYALQHAIKKGYKVAIISGGKSKSIKQKLSNLGISDIYLGSHTKIDSYKEFIEIHNLNDNEILYAGDDIPDYEVMKRVGVATCPYDAAQEIKDICIYISPKKGGKGVARDVIEQVLKVHEKWMDAEALTW